MPHHVTQICDMMRQVKHIIPARNFHAAQWFENKQNLEKNIAPGKRSQ
jgi:hypothetical protein